MKKLFFLLGFLFTVNFSLMSQEVDYLLATDAMENIKTYLGENPATLSVSAVSSESSISDSRFTSAVLGGYFRLIESEGNSKAVLDNFIANLPLKNEDDDARANNAKDLLLTLVTKS